MADIATASRNPSLFRKVCGPFLSRPRLMSAILLGIVVYAVLSVAGVQLEPSSRAIVSWDVTCIWFVALALQSMRGQDQIHIKANVAAQDEGQGLIVTLVMIAAVASLAAVGVELSFAKDAHGVAKDLRVGLALVTVVVSWFMVQLVFALHYAHEYYAPDFTTADETDVVGGLNFPGNQEPDYWDFLHFAVVIGAACQTADIAFTARRLRRIGTVHGMIAFLFNTAVLALTINLLAGLF